MDNITLIYLLAVFVYTASKLTGGIGVYLIGNISIQHAFLLAVLDNVCIIILLIEISINPFLIVKPLSLKLNFSHCFIYF